MLLRYLLSYVNWVPYNWVAKGLSTTYPPSFSKRAGHRVVMVEPEMIPPLIINVGLVEFWPAPGPMSTPYFATISPL